MCLKGQGLEEALDVQGPLVLKEYRDPLVRLVPQEAAPLQSQVTDWRTSSSTCRVSCPMSFILLSEALFTPGIRMCFQFSNHKWSTEMHYLLYASLLNMHFK